MNSIKTNLQKKMQLSMLNSLNLEVIGIHSILIIFVVKQFNQQKKCYFCLIMIM